MPVHRFIRSGSVSRITMSSYEIDDEDVSPDELDERAEDALDGDYVSFEEHAEKRE